MNLSISVSWDGMLCHWVSSSTYTGTQCYTPEDSFSVTMLQELNS
jgi:hypothetical protein